MKSRTSSREPFTIWFFLMLLNRTFSVTCFFISAVGDSPRKEHSRLSSRSVSCKQKTGVILCTYIHNLTNSEFNVNAHLNHILVEQVKDIRTGLFLVPPASHMIIPGTKHHCQITETQNRGIITSSLIHKCYKSLPITHFSPR